MKAIVYEKYGPPDVLHLAEVAKPPLTDDSVLVRVCAASVNAYDGHLLTADVFLVRLNTGLLSPKKPILGADIAGRVESVGRNVTQFRPGDEVFGDISACGNGGLAEYVCVPESALALKPVNLSCEQAAAVPMAANTALQGLRDQGHLQPGHKVLINGASGGVGTFAVQIARVLGAEVTAVCSPRNCDQARSLGADHVIDYTRDDFTRSGQQYDLILAANGYHTLAAYKRALSPRGIYVMVGGSMAQAFEAMLLGPMLSQAGGRKLGGVVGRPNQTDLVYLKGLLETGQVVPIIDKSFPLSEVPEALRYLLAGHARGKVVINVEHNIT